MDPGGDESNPHFPDGVLRSDTRQPRYPHEHRIGELLDHETGANPMGEGGKGALRVDFDRGLLLEFHVSKVTSDGGLLAYRDLDEVLGPTETAGERLEDWRTGTTTRQTP
jgi:hypothetical protein